MALFSNTSIYGTANVNSTLAVTAGIPSTSPTTGSVVVTGGAGVSGNVSATKVFSNNVDILNFAQAASAQANTISATHTIIQGVNATQNTNITATNTMTGSAYGQANTGTTLAQAAFTTSNTATGNISALNSAAVFGGGSVQLNGTNKYLQTSGSSAQVVGDFNNTSNFCIEAWVYPTNLTQGASINTAIPAVIGNMDPVGGINNWSFGVTPQGYLSLMWYNSGLFVCRTANTVSNNVWTHIAVNVTAGVVKLFINGVSETLTGTTTLTGTDGAYANLTIGQWTGTNGSIYNGYISNLRVIKSSFYTANFTPSTTPLTAVTGTSLLTFQSASTITDASPNAYTITSTGATASALTPFTAAAAAGTEATQNTNITATNTFATAAYGQANTGTTLAQAAYNSSNAFSSVITYSTPTTAIFSYVSVGRFSTYAIRAGDYSIWQWGYFGPSALPTAAFSGSTPRQYTMVEGGNGNFYTALATDGTLWCGGVATSSSPAGSSFESPVQVGAGLGTFTWLGSGATSAITSNGNLYTWASTSTTPTQITGINPVSKVSGLGYLYAITTDGSTIYQINGSTVRKTITKAGTTWQQVSAVDTTYDALALDTAGNMYYINVTTGATTLISGGWKYIGTADNGNYYAIATNGSLYSWGPAGNNAGRGNSNLTSQATPTLVTTGPGNFTQVQGCLNNHQVALGTNGYLYTWGDNNGNGQLGYTIGTASGIITRAGSTVAGGANTPSGGTPGILSNAYTQANTATTLAQGAYNAANTGISGLNLINDTTSVVTSPVSWKEISRGLGQNSYHTLAIRSDGALFAWGKNSNGQIGDGTTVNKSSPVQIGSSSWTKVAATALSSLGITTTGALFTWGASVASSTPVQIGSSSWSMVAGGSDHALAITTTGALYGLGDNYFGQIGDGTTVVRSFISPVPIGSSSWSKIGAGDRFSLGITTTGALFAWGRNNSGQIGDGTTVNKSSPVKIGSSSWSMVAGGSTASEGGHSLGITTTGALFAWGYNNYGQLGNSTTTSASTPVQIGSSSWNFVSAAQGQSFAISTTGALYSWGTTGAAGLGDGAFTGRSSPVQIGSSSWTIIGGSAGSSAAVTTTGVLFGWGDGTDRAHGYSAYGGNQSTPASLVPGMTTSTNVYNTGVNTTQNNRITAVNTFATSAYGQANTETTLAQAAYNAANTIPAMITNAQGVDATQNTNITAMNTFATGAYGQANTGTTLAQAAFTAANNTVSILTPVSGYLVNGTNYGSVTGGLPSSAGGAYTIEFWFNANSFNTDATWTPRKNVIYQQENTYISIGSTQLGWQITGLGSGADYAALPTNTWHHFALSSDGTILSIYINGVIAGQWPTFGSRASFAAGNFVIGSASVQVTAGYPDALPFNGYISNFRYVVGTGLYPANFTVPSFPLAAVTGTKLLTYVSSPTVDQSGNYTVNYNGTVSTKSLGVSGTNGPLSSAYNQANTGTTLAQAAFTKANTNIASINTITDTNTLVSGGGSVSFNGTSSYLSIPSSTNVNLSSGNFTIEAWVYSNGTNTSATIIDKDGTFGTAVPSYDLALSSGKLSFSIGSGNGLSSFQQILAPATLPTNQWVHVAAVKNGTNLSLYQNGTSVGSATQTATITDGGKTLFVGWQTGQPTAAYWSGYISNVRIVKGSAVYTANFTPNATLTAITGTQLLTCQSSSTITDASPNAYTIANNGGAATASSQAPSGGVLNIGVNTTQNNRITAVNTFATSAYGQANTATAATVYNQGVDATQNTNITSVNTFANAAYASANTKLPLAGSYTGVSGPIGGSIKLSPTSGNYALSYPSTFGVEGRNYTIEFWIYRAAGGTGSSELVRQGGSYTDPGNGKWKLDLNNASGQLQFAFNYEPSVYRTRIDGYAINVGTIPVGQWTHVCITRSLDGANNRGGIASWINGVTIYPMNFTELVTNNQQPYGSTELYFGKNLTSDVSISNFRMSDYSVYGNVGNFTVPTSPLTSSGSTYFLTGNSSSSITDAKAGLTFTNNGATAQAISPFSVNTLALTYPITGNLSISNNLQISGNLTSTGAVTSLNAVSTDVSDSLVELARNNTTGDTSDIGFAAQSNDGTTTSYSGVIRDAATKEFYVYQGYTGAVTGNNVDSTDASFAKGTLNANQLKGSLIGSSAIINGRELGAYTSTVYAQSNTGTTLAQATFNSANTNASAITVIQGTNTTQNTNIGAVNTLAGSAYATSNTGASDITVIEGVNTKQNTDIVSATTLAQAAFSYANTVLPVLNTSTTFTDITLGTNDLLTSGNVTVTGLTTVDSFSSNLIRSAKYEVQMTSGTSYQVIEVRVVTDGNNVWLTQFGDIRTGDTLGTISGSMASGIFSLTVNPVNDGTVVRFYRSALKV